MFVSLYLFFEGVDLHLRVNDSKEYTLNNNMQFYSYVLLIVLQIFTNSEKYATISSFILHYLMNNIKICH